MTRVLTISDILSGFAIAAKGVIEKHGNGKGKRVFLEIGCYATSMSVNL